MKVYELRELSLKFERHLVSEIINFEVPFLVLFGLAFIYLLAIRLCLFVVVIQLFVCVWLIFK